MEKAVFKDRGRTRNWEGLDQRRNHRDKVGLPEYKRWCHRLALVWGWEWGEGFGETAAIGSITAAWVAFHNGIVFGAILKRVDGWCLVLKYK